MKFGKLVPFGFALALTLSGCSSGNGDGGQPACPGGCGPNSSCINAVCVCFDGGYAQCGTTDAGQPICPNILSDDNNCGGCGVACPQPGLLTSCENGSCACLLQTCPMADGGLGCYDTTSDFTNCGGCTFATPPSGVTCDFGQACFNSICSCANGFTSCPPLIVPDGGTDAGYCADTTTDSQNCGTCGNVCPHDQKCIQPTPGATGQCVCNLGEDGGSDLIPCASGCVHSNSDPRNCGMCNVQCDTGICTAGVCQCDPDAGILQCTQTTCANVTSDVKNCGFCGNDCTQGGTLMFPDIVCQSGQCRCQGGQQDICASAAPFPPVLACIDTTSDPNNCGGCGLLVDGGGPFSDGGLPPSPYICSGVKDACTGGNCNCPNNGVFCGPGTYTADAGFNDGGVCLNTTADPVNCGACGNNCNVTYAPDSFCQYSNCLCNLDAGMCVVTDDPFNPTCDCNGPFNQSPPNPLCSTIPTLTYTHDIFPLFNSTYVGDAGWANGGILIGCATSGCHSPGNSWIGDGGQQFNDGGAAAGLDFTDPDASYQVLAGGSSPTVPGCSTTVLNPSSICLCESLTVPTNGSYTISGGSLLYGLLSNQIFNCQNPVGGIVNPMPIDDGGHPYPLNACLQTQVRQWIDQGAAY